MRKGVPNKMVAERGSRPSRRGHSDTWSESSDEGGHVGGDSAEYVTGTDEDDRQSYTDDSPVIPRARLKSVVVPVEVHANENGDRPQDRLGDRPGRRPARPDRPASPSPLRRTHRPAVRPSQPAKATRPCRRNSSSYESSSRRGLLSSHAVKYPDVNKSKSVVKDVLRRNKGKYRSKSITGEARGSDRSIPVVGDDGSRRFRPSIKSSHRSRGRRGRRYSHSTGSGDSEQASESEKEIGRKSSGSRVEKEYVRVSSRYESCSDQSLGRLSESKCPSHATTGPSGKAHKKTKEAYKVHKKRGGRADDSPGRGSRRRSHKRGDQSRSHKKRHRHRPVSRSGDRDEKREASRAEGPRGVLPTLKLSRYDGSQPLETFLAKFDNCCQYYNWSEREKVCHLRNALEGRAGAVLLETKRQDTVDQLIQLLKSRFGSQDQTERFRIELKARRRGKNESLQSLFNDICRLMTLAYPGQSGSLCDIMARDIFLEALDPSLRLKILERDTEPVTIEDALRVACRLEAIRKTADDERLDDVRRREKNIRGVQRQEGMTAEQVGGKIADLEKTVAECKKELDRTRLLNEQLLSRANRAEESEWTLRNKYESGRDDVPTDNQEGDPSRRSRPGGRFPGHMDFGDSHRGRSNYRFFRRGPGRWTRGRMTRDTCRNCGKSGHWAIDCPDSVVTGVTEMTGRTVPKRRTTVRKPETYIEVEMKNQ